MGFRLDLNQHILIIVGWLCFTASMPDDKWWEEKTKRWELAKFFSADATTPLAAKFMATELRILPKYGIFTTSVLQSLSFVPPNLSLSSKPVAEAFSRPPFVNCTLLHPSVLIQLAKGKRERRGKVVAIHLQIGNCNTDLVLANTIGTQQLQRLQWLSVKPTNKEICFRGSLEEEKKVGK